MRAYGEAVPPVGAVACTGGGGFSVVGRVACAARAHNLTVVVNVIDVVPCGVGGGGGGGDPHCPPDGFYNYNTDVVLDGAAGGAVAAVYHKSHLFGTAPLLDPPARPDPVSFLSSFAAVSAAPTMAVAAPTLSKRLLTQYPNAVCMDGALLCSC